jgi:type VI secretion system FHA domain protein
MSLTLTLVQSPPGVRAPAESKSFDERGGTIGRSPQNDWHLPDPANRVSREHCRIVWDGARYYLEDVSANGVFLNGSPNPVGRGNRVPLGNGDRIVIGDYEATVAVSSERAAPGAVFGPQPDDDPFAAAGARQAAGAPFGPAVGVRATTAFDLTGDAAGRGKGGPAIPADEDIFGPGEPPPAFGAPRQAPVPWAPEPVETPPSAADHSPSPQDFFRPPGVVNPGPGSHAIPDDWDAEPGATPAAAAAAPAARPAPPPAAAEPPLQPAARAPAPLPPDEAGDRALRAFLDGAGMPDLMIRPDQADAVMRLAGATYREMVTALREIIEARAALKREFRVESTLIRAARNNPLKFAPTVEAALATMLSNDQRGYQPAPDAVREAGGDIKAHELATFAAVQEVMAELLQRLAPAAVEQSAAKSEGLGSLVAGGRRARAWEEFLRTYAAVKEHFDDRFAEVFRRKYEEAFRQMR